MVLGINQFSLQAQIEPDSTEFGTSFDDSLIYQSPIPVRQLANAVVRFQSNASVFLEWSSDEDTLYTLSYKKVSDTSWVTATTLSQTTLIHNLPLDEEFMWRVWLTNQRDSISGIGLFSTHPQQEPISVSSKLYNQLTTWFSNQDSTKTFCDFLTASDAHLYEKLSFIQAYGFDNADFVNAFNSTNVLDWYPNSGGYTINGCLPNRLAGCGCKVFTSGVNRATPNNGLDENAGIVTPKIKQFIARDGNDRTFIDRFVAGAAKYAALRQDEGGGGMSYRLSNLPGGSNDASSVTTTSSELHFFLACYRDGGIVTNLPEGCSCERPLTIKYAYSSNLYVKADKKNCWFSKGAAAQAEDFALVTVWNRGTGELTALDVGHHMVGRKCNSEWNPDFWIEIANLTATIGQYLITSSATGSNLPTAQQMAQFTQQIQQLIGTPFSNNNNNCGNIEQEATLVSGDNVLTLRPNAALQINLYSAYYLRTRGYGCWIAQAGVASDYFLAGVVQSQLTDDPECCSDKFGNFVLGSLSTPENGDVVVDAPNNLLSRKQDVGTFLPDFGSWLNYSYGSSSGQIIVSKEFDLLRGPSCVLDQQQRLLNQSDKFKSKQFIAYPSIVDNILYIQTDNINSDAISFLLYNTNGQLINEYKLFTYNPNSSTETLDLSHLQTGLYVLSSFINGEMFTFKFYKK